MVKEMAAIVAASTSSRGIGYQGQLPWKLSPDMKHFKSITMTAPANKRNAVIMGRKTWESIPPKFRPLPGRFNVILTRNTQWMTDNGDDNILIAHSFQEATKKVQAMEAIHDIFVIGGAQVYAEAMTAMDRIYYTQVDSETKMDAFFPPIEDSEWTVVNSNDENSAVQVDPESGLTYRFLEYARKRNDEEQQYLHAIQEILDHGVRRGDRTGTGTLSKFGMQMRFNLRDGRLPLLTTKRVFWRGVAEELLWFMSGNTNANALAEKDIHIWDGNGSREFLDQRGLTHREVGDLGPVYGFQWRHFGAKYVSMHTDYTGQGVDQLADCIEKIKNNPEDRRIIMSAWNPADLNLMALPPCHMFCQFYVDTEKNELSCQMYQRSADMGLGVPFNIASYALLTHLIAHVTGRKPGDFVHTIGDAHVYVNHVEALQEQLQRRPRDFPVLKINPDKTDIDSFVYDDFEVVGYKPHKTIKMEMAV